MTILGIIPSRYHSVRFPGKPLAVISGKSMIQRVYEQALKAESLKKVVVATDDDRIFRHVLDFGGAAVMTSANHRNGTERCAEALLLDGGKYDGVINIQGDEPFIQPEQIDLVAGCLKEGAEIATLVKRITIPEELNNASVVKVTVNKDSDAVDFCRKLAAPLERQSGRDFSEAVVFYKHIGIYGYKAALLPVIAKLPPSRLERLHSLEQLRWLHHGFKIKAKETVYETLAVDTPEDLKKLADIPYTK